MKFEEVLPALRDGRKIRRRVWLDADYIYIRDGSIVDNDGDFFEIDFSITLNDDWEIIEEPKYDWDYIIENQCPCWFWDEDVGNKVLCTLNSIEADIRFPYKDCISTTGWKHCRPVRKDEIKFYEDRKEEEE